MRNATSRWNIEVSDAHQGGQASPTRVSRACRRCRAGSRRPAPARRPERTRIEGERIRLDDLEPPRIARGDLGEGRDAARVALDRDDPRGAGREKRARQTAGPGPISTTVDARERAGGAGDAAGQVEVEQEILAERFLGLQAVRAHDLAQGWQVVDLAHLASESRAASFRRGDQAVGPRDAMAGDVERRAVIGRGAHEGQAERDVDRLVEGDRLDRDQRLIVIHGERRVVASPRPRVEHGVRGQRTRDGEPLGTQTRRPRVR